MEGVGYLLPPAEYVALQDFEIPKTIIMEIKMKNILILLMVIFFTTTAVQSKTIEIILTKQAANTSDTSDPGTMRSLLNNLPATSFDTLVVKSVFVPDVNTGATIFANDLKSLREFLKGNSTWTAGSMALDLSNLVISTLGNTTLSGNSSLNISIFKEVILPESFTGENATIGNDNFQYWTYLQKINIPEGVKTFGNNVFRNTKLEFITFPSTLTATAINSTTIFQGINTLKWMQFKTMVPPVGDINAFSGIAEDSRSNVKVIVPNDAKAAYTAHTAFTGMTIIEEKETIITIIRENKKAGDYGTICLPAAFVEMTNAILYQVLGVTKDNNGNPQTLYLTDTVEKMLPGTAYIYKTIDDGAVTFTCANDKPITPIVNNGLIGALVETPIEQNGNNYILSADNRWYLVNSDYTCGANFAYLKLNEVFVFDTPPANTCTILGFNDNNVTNIHEDQLTIPSKVDIYTLQGVKIRRQVERIKALDGLQRGIYIMNGEKVAVF